MATQLDEALGAGVTFSTGALSMTLGAMTDAVPVLAAWLGLMLVAVRLVYEGIKLKRYWREKNNGKRSG